METNYVDTIIKTSNKINLCFGNMFLDFKIQNLMADLITVIFKVVVSANNVSRYLQQLQCSVGKVNENIDVISFPSKFNL